MTDIKKLKQGLIKGAGSSGARIREEDLIQYLESIVSTGGTYTIAQVGRWALSQYPAYNQCKHPSIAATSAARSALKKLGIL